MAIRDEDVDREPFREHALVERFSRTKDPEAFAALVASTRPWLVSMCARLLGGDRHAAEDVAQDSYLKAFRLLANGGSTLDFRAWLAAVARNACIDELRKIHAVPVSRLPEPDAHVDDEPGLDAPLERAWTALHPRQRRLIFLREVMGMSYREIADETAATLPAVETALFRAKASLRRHYRRAGGSAQGLAWLGIGLRGFLRTGRERVSELQTRWTAWAQARLDGVLGQIPGAGQSGLAAGAASLTAVAVLATGMFVSSRTPAESPSTPPAAVSAVSAPAGHVREAAILVASDPASAASKEAAKPDGLGLLPPLSSGGGSPNGQDYWSHRREWRRIQHIGSAITTSAATVTGALDAAQEDVTAAVAAAQAAAAGIGVGQHGADRR